MRVAILTTLVAAAAASGLVGHGVGLVGHGAVVGHAAVGGLGRGYLGAGRALGVVHAGRAVHGVHGGYADNYAEPRPFHYQYAVDDPHYGPMFNKEEQSDGAGNVQGYYAVNLPDGRTQHVKYVADHYNGYNAEVTYEGYANHPQVARGYGPGVGRGVVHGVRGVAHGAVLGAAHGVAHGAGYGYTPVYRSALH